MNDAPIRVRLYGLFPVTRRGYVFQLVLAGVLLIGLLFLWSYLDNAVSAWPAGDVPANVERARGLARWLPLVVALIALLYGIEAYFVFRRFAKKEAERRAQTPASTPQP